MFNRKKLYRERLEMYLVYLMMAYRPFTLLLALLWAVGAAYAFTLDSLAGAVLLVVTIFLASLGSSFRMIVFTARFITWVAVLFKREF